MEPLPETDAVFRAAMVEAVERSRLRAASLAYVAERAVRSRGAARRAVPIATNR